MSQEELDLEVVKRVIRKLHKKGVKKLHITGGEPLLRNDLEEIAAYAHQHKMTTFIATNGLLLNNVRLKRLKQCGADRVFISLGDLQDVDRIERIERQLKQIPEVFKQSGLGLNVFDTSQTEC